MAPPPGRLSTGTEAFRVNRDHRYKGPSRFPSFTQTLYGLAGESEGIPPRLVAMAGSDLSRNQRKVMGIPWTDDGILLGCDGMTIVPHPVLARGLDSAGPFRVGRRQPHFFRGLPANDGRLLVGGWAKEDFWSSLLTKAPSIPSDGTFFKGCVGREGMGQRRY